MGVGSRGIELRTMEDAWRMATAVVKSGLAPRGINTAEAALIAIQSGMELGMTPMQSLQNLTVINGKMGITGDAALALVQSSGLMEEYDAHMEGAADQRRAVIVSRRRGRAAEYRTEFAVADAKKAGLWGKAGPWTQYPDRMLHYRCLGFHLRDYYPEPLKGFKTSEELQDYPTRADQGPRAAAAPPPAPKPEPEPVTIDAAEWQEVEAEPELDPHSAEVIAAVERGPVGHDDAAEKRDKRARALAAAGHVVRTDDAFEVTTTGRQRKTYRVWRDRPDTPVRCSCPEHKEADDRRFRCEHILAVKYHLEPLAEDRL